MDFVLLHTRIFRYMLRAERMVFAENDSDGEKQYCSRHKRYDKYQLAHNTTKYGAKVRKKVDS
jgi:hypothetical protein